jgi:hypothetical protein
MRLALLLATFCLTTQIASAAVSINEVAWMGGTASANHEWIELYNSSSEAISVEGWILVDGLNLNITLSGRVGAGDFAVLERTSDDSASGSAFLIYTGALVNGGATLTLLDSNGGVKDQVTGGTDWQNIGGDNVTKETAQYTSSGWVTDTPTPGDQNRGGRVVDTSTETNNETTSANTTSSSRSSGSSKSTSSSVDLKNHETKITLKPIVQSVAYVNQRVPFTVTTEGLDEGSKNLVHYEWNFGDGNTALSRKTEHVYTYPGNYVVTVYGKKDKAEQTVRHEITVLPVNFSITSNLRGDTQIHNNAAYDVDLSDYAVQGLSTFVIPPRTIMLPRGTITIPASKLGGTGQNSLIALYDATRVLVTSNFEKHNNIFNPPAQNQTPNQNIATAVTTEIRPQNNSESSSAIGTNDFGFISTPLALASEVDEEEISFEEEPISIPESKDERKENRWPYLALIGVLLAGCMGVWIKFAT